MTAAPPAEPPARGAVASSLPRYRGTPFSLTFKWVLAGALLYALLLALAIALRPDEAAVPILAPDLYLTPIFGLPYLIAAVPYPGRLRRLLFFVLLVPLAHVAANYLAWAHAVANYDPLDRSGEFGRDLASGAIGGVSGATLSFTLLHLARLVPGGRTSLRSAAVATLVLAAIGAAGMAFGIAATGGIDAARHSAGRLIFWYEAVHLPWQAAFALCLAWLMRRPARPRRRAPAVPEGYAVPGGAGNA